MLATTDATATAPRLPALDAPARRKIGLAVVSLALVCTWALAHGYEGLRHDARLYTLLALERLRPDSLGQDVFVRFGSQDQFTLFSPVYALAIRCLGIEPAAASLTLLLQIAFLAGAAMLARRLVSPSLALLGVSVLLAVPGFYGADEVFRCIESFLTPRMGAEALVLFALAAAMSSRPRLAWLLATAAMLVHPVMAAAGLAALAFHYVGRSSPRRVAILIGTGVALLALAAATVPSGPFGRLDPQWLELLRARSPYAFLLNWSLDDWGRVSLPLATLAIGARFLTTPDSRSLSLVVLLTATTGLALTLIACDGLRLTLITQLQPWRWEWLALTVAALLAPAIAAAAWQSSRAGRITTLLLASAWTFESGPFAIQTALAAVASMALQPWSARNETRLVLYGAVGVALIALAYRVASSLLFLETFYADPQIALWIRQIASLTADGGIPVTVILCALWLTTRKRGTPALLLLAVGSAALCICLLPDAWRRWSHQQFPPALRAQFAPWRALIPPGRDVFWSEAAPETWILLERPNYLSVVQTAGMMFSRAAALEMQRRAEALSAVVPAAAYLRLGGGGAGIGPSARQLEQACATSEFEFLVTPARLTWRPVAQLPADAWHSSGGLRLYRCSDRTT